MAGHSKWAQIKRQKGVADQKRGALFSKLARGITLAAKNGTDPEMNFQLRMAIDAAKQANMPKDNIDRAIEKVKGAGADTIEEIIYEAYGPGGTAFIIETATDNRNRAVGEIKAVLTRNGGKLAESGSVSYLFKKVGQIVLNGADLDEAELAAIDAGAHDIERGEKELFVYTAANELERVRKSLEKDGFSSNEISLEWLPSSPVPISDKETAEKVLRLSELLEEIEDVSKVYGNFDLDENIID
jgi:YebC/PmpR family DNA-binding regulatory protein